MGKKRKFEWEPVALPESLITSGVDGLIGIEQLNDYQVERNELDSVVSAPKKCKVSERKPAKGKQVVSKLKHNEVTRKNNACSWVVTSIGNNETLPSPIQFVGKKKTQNVQNAKKKSRGTIPLGKKTKRHIDTSNFQNDINGTISSDSLNKNIELDGMEAWSSFNVSVPILRALNDLGFQNPTEIQERTLPSAIMGRRDILGAAETGSGKTLAFGIPIIHGILKQKMILSQKRNNNISNIKSTMDVGQVNLPNDSLSKSQDQSLKDFRTVQSSNDRKLYALILTPTRELAIQVKDHLVAVAKYTDIKIAVVVGGLASQKQERMLKKCPEIVVATPGRLWELIETGNPHLERVDDISFLAIDETDRMLQKGHFQELQTILQRINCNEFKKKKRQNFVFSATLTLVHEPPKHLHNRKAPTQITPGQKLLQIIAALGITNPKVVDITHEKGTAGKLREARIVCSLTEKDSYLYYFLMQFKGRTLVFCNSISCVRRLVQILEILQCKPFPLHANMQQRQRLKNLERFRDNPNGLLIATDVAARGLDIPNVQHVIHYQVPRTTESYVHRSGRTARAQKEGITVLLMEPEEATFYLRLCKNLGRDHDLPDFPVDHTILKVWKRRVNLSQQIDKLQHSSRRASSQQGWFQKTAKDMDMLLDEDDLPHQVNEESSAQIKNQINGLRKQLQFLLAEPVFPKSSFLNQSKMKELKANQYNAISVVNEKKKTGAFVKFMK